MMILRSPCRPPLANNATIMNSVSTFSICKRLENLGRFEPKALAGNPFGDAVMKFHFNRYLPVLV